MNNFSINVLYQSSVVTFVTKACMQLNFIVIELIHFKKLIMYKQKKRIQTFELNNIPKSIHLVLIYKYNAFTE